ncbi:MAG: type I 3-dehydroquinate dehydratase [Candidatus Syntrophoarchaeum sp. WYZ-LMO15]|nr:MAG: type I 3-dehydroquinate dehydratase [Candidatus Syntrophoarchaeum sp. WYZ-LMO15]
MDEPLIVGVIDEPEIDKAELARQMGADVLEARFDLWNTSMDTSRQVLRDLKKVGLDIIGTNRWIIEGGGFEGSEPDRIGFLISCMDLLDYVDIELECEMRDYVVERAKKQGVKVIVSYHNFEFTPDKDELLGIVSRMKACGADIGKVATMVNDLHDSLRLFELLLDANMRLSVIGMGELGRHTRIIAPIYGSVLNYGSVGGAVAPGQMRVEEMRKVWGWLL